MKYSTFYTTEPIAFSDPSPEGVAMTAIRSLTGELMYLIEGRQKALLIDTCLGVGNLKKLVDSLTDKPISVLLTHGHIDHAMGAADFDMDQVYMNPVDLPLYEQMKGIEERKGYIAGNLGLSPKDEFPFFDADFTVQPEVFSPKPLNDGDVFDLGGVQVEVYALPGHTMGSMIMLIPQLRILITGDACNKSTFLFDASCAPLADYRDHLRAMAQKLEGRYDRVFICHHEIEMPKDILNQVANVCDEVLSDISDEVPFSFMGKNYLIAKAVDERFNRLDHGIGNIIYDREKVRREKQI